jgi:hypothetical protein
VENHPDRNPDDQNAREECESTLEALELLEKYVKQYGFKK